MINCSLVPANWPRTAWTMLLGGWIVSEYMNMFEVVAMFAAGRSKPARLIDWSLVRWAVGGWLLSSFQSSW